MGCAGPEGLDHFRVCDGGEGAVESAYANEGIWLMETEESVDQGADAVGGLDGGYGYGNPDGLRLVLSDQLDGMQKGATGGDAVIDEDDGFLLQARKWFLLAI